MKCVCALLLIIVAGRVALGCSDDGVYTPVEQADELDDGGTDAPPFLDASK